METIQKIKNAGLKVTPQRQLIYNVVSELCHATIDDIVEKIKETSPDITISTVYRVLNSFCCCNLLAKVHLTNGKTYYDINVHEHCHAVTSKEGLVDLNDDELIRIVKERLSLQISDTEQIDKISIQITTSAKAE